MVEGPLRRLLNRNDETEPVKWERPYHEVEVMRDYAQIKQDISEILDDPMGISAEEIRTKINRLNDTTNELSDKGVIDKKVYRGMKSHINAMNNILKRRDESGIYDFRRMNKATKDTNTFVLEKLEPEIAKWFLSRGALGEHTDASPDRYEQLRKEQWGD